jgi:hypothetical protein
MVKRKINRYVLIVVAFICFSFCTQNILAQTPSVKTTLDKRDILIGQYLQYKVSASFPSGIYKVNWFTVPDSVAHFELVEKSKIDTSTENNITSIQQTITLTSFDSGRWQTPAFPVIFDPVKDDSALHLFTDSIPVNVGYMPADSTNELRDIKPIMDVTIKSYLWYYIGGGILLLIILSIILWRFLKNRKKEPDVVFSSKLSPYDEAIQQLEKLKQLNLQNAEELKQFHARLSNIFKWYISRKQRVSIMNKTTGDVLVHLADNNLPKETIADAATALRCGDAVKFAKYTPPVNENEECLAKIKATINFIHTSKPETNKPETSKSVNK